MLRTAQVLVPLRLWLTSHKTTGLLGGLRVRFLVSRMAMLGSLAALSGGRASFHLPVQPSRSGVRTRSQVRSQQSTDPPPVTKRKLRPVVERFRINHEKNVSEERLKELGVKRWSKWECGPFVTTYWKWETDEMIYITKGSLEFCPEGCDVDDSAFFYAGDLVRFPKWLEGNASFDDDYEHFYKYFAYGD